MVPKPNEIYRHFKGNLYKIIAIAVHTETDEEMVVYQALYGNYMIYCRPLQMFCSKLDPLQYPDATQEFRFEKVDAILEAPFLNEREGNKKDGIFRTEEQKNGKECATVKKEPSEMDFDDDEGEFAVDQDVLAFLDAETVQERKNILAKLHERITDDMIYTMAIALDIVIDEGDLEDRYRQLMTCLDTIEKYEIER